MSATTTSGPPPSEATLPAPPQTLGGKVRTFLEAIKFEHTIFALPFAYLGMLLAAGGAPTLAQVFWITVAMGAARTLAMVLNRLIDREIDARNPRTANRALPRRLLSAREMALFCALSLALLVLAAWQLNPLCLQLLPGAVVVLVGYSYTKRFTWASHFVLGLADALAPIGGWVAVTGALAPEALLLGFAVGVWIAGFDVLYACQDVEFDRASGLHSIPARFGIPAALTVAKVLHVLTVAALAGVGLLLGLGPVYGLGVLVAAGLLIYEHSLLKADDLSRLDMAFFNVNGYIAVILFLATAGDLALSWLMAR
jgi:4-hydroxybenzoate polyprenyltransferase